MGFVSLKEKEATKKIKLMLHSQSQMSYTQTKVTSSERAIPVHCDI